jgi:acid stress chaperone HdeA
MRTQYLATAIAVGVSMAAAGLAHAEAPASPAAGKPSITKMSCQAFTRLDERFQPTIVSYAVAYDRRGKPLDEVVDVKGIEEATPALVKSCKAAPRQGFLERFRADAHRLLHPS